MKAGSKKAREVFDALQRHADPGNVEGMARFGIRAASAYGVSLPLLRRMAKAYRNDHALALELWSTGVHEARLLAIFIDDPEQVTPPQIESWAEDFASWDITDQCCNHLISRTAFAQDKIVEWEAREEEFVRRAAFALIASLAVHGKRIPDATFVRWLGLVEHASDDERNFVKKAVNWALRQIGKRNMHLHAEALRTAHRVAAKDSRAARWIARDALRELQNEQTLARVRAKSAPTI